MNTFDRLCLRLAYDVPDACIYEHFQNRGCIRNSFLTLGENQIPHLKWEADIIRQSSPFDFINSSENLLDQDFPTAHVKELITDDKPQYICKKNESKAYATHSQKEILIGKGLFLN